MESGNESKTLWNDEMNIILRTSHYVRKIEKGAVKARTRR